MTGANATAAAGSLRQNYTYDVYGNMTSTEMAGITTPIATESSSNHLSGAGVQYDAAGNLIQAWSHGDTIAYKYDSLNMLQQVTDTQGNNIVYLYTADNERIWSYDLAANVSHWKIRDLNRKVLRDYVQDGSTWSVAKDYFYRDGLLLAAAAPSGVTEHFSLDHLGTPRLITDQNHNKIGFHVYFPFGNEWSGVGQQETPAETMRFTGHERDKDLTGSGDFLDYMHARYYTPLLARFLSFDPVSGDRLNPQSWNRYAYALNNPMNRTDPDGRQEKDAPCSKSDSSCTVPTPPPSSSATGSQPQKTAEQTEEQKNTPGEKLNFLPKDDPNQSAAKWNSVPNNTILINSHGSNATVNHMNAQQLAKRIKSESKTWHPGMTIILNSCNAAKGDNSIAQQLSAEMHTTVKGNDQPVWTFGPLDLGSWGSTGNGDPKSFALPDLTTGGNQVTFVNGVKQDKE